MINKAAELILSSKKTTVFTGAGISVESGIPPFRGRDGLWSNYDPIILDLNYYMTNTDISWPIIKELFYDFFGKAKPNLAHEILAAWEKSNLVKEIITQNIDNLHQEAGSQNVYEFHGTANTFVCTACNKHYLKEYINISSSPPSCLDDKCNSLLKPNFIFFGEGIPLDAYKASMEAAETSDVFIIIGTTGEIMPASQIPILAKRNGTQIIEINTNHSNYTNTITDIFLQGKATSMLEILNEKIISLLTK